MNVSTRFPVIVPAILSFLIAAPVFSAEPLDSDVEGIQPESPQELIIPPVVIEVPEINIKLDLEIGELPLKQSQLDPRFIAREKWILEKKTNFTL